MSHYIVVYVLYYLKFDKFFRIQYCPFFQKNLRKERPGRVQRKSFLQLAIRAS